MNENKLDIAWEWALIDDFTSREIHEVLMERTRIFVVEQNSAYQEVDEYDLSSWHLTGRIGNRLVAYARVVFPDTKYELPSIGRIIIKKEYRKKGISKEMIRLCIEKSQQEFPDNDIFLQAQHRLQPFYEAFGFERISEVYDDAGFDHIDMVLKVK